MLTFTRHQDSTHNLPDEVGAVVILVLHVRELRFSECEGLVQGLETGKKQSNDMFPFFGPYLQ